MIDTLLDSPPQAQPQPAAPGWADEFAKLRARFPKTKETIVFCVHALQQSQNVSLDELKAQAQMHGLRVTAASLHAARRLLDPQAAATARAARKVTAGSTAVRGREAAPEGDIEGLLRQVVDRVRLESDARAAKMRAAIREALLVIDQALQ